MRLSIFLIIILFVPWAIFAHGAEAASAPVGIVQNLVLFLHIITAVFMAWPLYALITVNERPKVGAPLGDKVDEFMEGIVKKQSVRCYVFQITALATGLYLVWSHEDLGFAALFTNWLLLGKLLGLFLLMGLLSYVIFFVQPIIDKHFEDLKTAASKEAKESVAGRIMAMRARRKKIAAVCLFTVLAIILFAVQIREPFSILIDIIVLVLIALFVCRTFKANIPYGWI